MTARKFAQAYRALHFRNGYTQVERPGGSWWCSCPDYRIRREAVLQTCKHIRMERMGHGEAEKLAAALKNSDKARVVRVVDEWIEKWTSNRRVKR